MSSMHLRNSKPWLKGTPTSISNAYTPIMEVNILPPPSLNSSNLKGSPTRQPPHTLQSRMASQNAQTTVIEKIQPMLIEAKLSHGFWSEAARFAIHVSNCSPHAALKNKT